MNPFTALKNLSPFHFTSLLICLFHFLLFFYLSYQPLTSLHFAIHIYYSLSFTSLSFTSYFLSPLLPLTGFHFPYSHFENTCFTVGSPYCPFRQFVPFSNGPIHKGIFKPVSLFFIISWRFPVLSFSQKRSFFSNLYRPPIHITDFPSSYSSYPFCSFIMLCCFSPQ